MTFKIKDGVRIGTVDVFNNSAESLNLKVRDTGSNFSVAFTPATLGANRTYTLPNKDGTLAMISDLAAAANDGTLTLSIGTAGATNTSVTIGTGTGFSANTASNLTYTVKVGPAIDALVSTMTGATTGFLKKTAQDTYTLDTSTYATTSHTHYIGTTQVQSSSANQAATGILSVTFPGSSSGSVQLIPTAAAGTGTVITMPATTGTMALTSDIKAGTLDVSISGTAASSGTALAWGTATGHTANTATNYTYDLRVGPSLSALATLMTGATTGFIKKTAADTYTLDTSTYLTAEADTLQTVTGRGASSNVATITLSANTASTTTGTGTLVVTGGVGIGGALNVGGAGAIGGNLTVTGDLIVNGTTTTVNSTTLSVDDKNIELGSVASPTNTTADGGGITLKGATDKTFNWVNSTSAWTSSENMDLATGKVYEIAGTSVLSATTLGSGVVNSSLTKLGLTSAGFVKTDASGNLSVDTNTYLTSASTLDASKLSGTIPSAVLGNSTHYIGTTAVTLNRASANLALTGISSVAFPGATSGTITVQPTAIAGTNTITLPAATGTVALTSDIKDATLTLQIGTAGATNTTVTVGTGTGFSANASSNATYSLSVGPAITNLASTMTGAGSGFLKKTGADTYTVDTNTYLTAEADTLQTVTGRGNTSTNNIQINGAALVLAPSTVAKIWTQALAPANITANTAATIDSFATATYRSAKYTIQITQGTKYQVSEYRMIHDGSNVYTTEFSVLETNAGSPIPVTFSAAIATGTLTVSATITDAATTNAALIIERTLFAV